MLLKKQTVWLLTMLSLVVVLSVYYITSPETKSSNTALVEQNGKDQTAQSGTKTKTDTKDGKTVVTQAAGDADFEALRLKQEDQRSEYREELRSTVASTDLPAAERSKAQDEMKQLTDTAQKEEMLETLIRAMGYEDALVRADGDKVQVTVKAKKQPTASDANQIMQKVKKEITEINYVAVEYSPTK